MSRGLATAQAAALHERRAELEARAPSAGRIYLFGERHGETRQLDKEFELWRDFYAGGMRHLFVELPYFAAEFLNEWMREDGDEILEALFDDAKGTAGDTPQSMGFYRRIKAELPETVFHGTDVGHAHETTGARFLERLRESGQEPSERHSLAAESVEQGRLFYGALGRSLSAREGMMTSNFVRAFDDLNGESAMGIYGDAHVAFDGDKTHAIGATMAARLRERYGDSLSAAQLRDLLSALEPLRLDALTVDGTELKAAYFGEHAIGHPDIAKLEFWRLEDAYGRFKDHPKTEDVLPFGNYPMPVELSQVFAIRFTKKDGSADTLYHRSSGAAWEGMDVTEGFAAR